MKLFTTRPSGGNAVVSFRHKRIAVLRRFEWLHAHKGGGPVLRGESSSLCGGEVPLRWTVADHCHTTGWVRGLLCISCNKLESHPPRSIRDPDRAQALVRYRAHPPTSLLGLRVQYRDVREGWRFACAARHQAELDRLLAELEAQELRRAAPSPGDESCSAGIPASNVPASGPA